MDIEENMGSLLGYNALYPVEIEPKFRGISIHPQS
jgi:hypothetical protein